MTLKPWPASLVREYFDSHWDVTLHQLSALSGWPKADVKAILMGYDPS